MSIEVVHQPGSNQYVILDGEEEIGAAHYLSRENDIMITGTYISTARRGEGLGNILVRRSIDDIIATTNKKVTSGCWFVTQWLELHPNYVDEARSGGIDAELGNTCRII